MAAPFLAQFLPWKYTGLLFLPFIASVILTRARPSRIPPVLLLTVFLAVVHVLGLVFTDTPFAYQVIKELCIFALLLVVFLLAGEEATDGFFAVIVPLGVITAVLGLVKMAMLDRGYLFGPLVDAMTDSGSCSTYPWGTSPLCLDYNILGLLWLLAIIGAMKSRWWLVAATVVAGGMLLGSRRFILLAPFLPVVWIVLERKKALLKVAAVAAIALLLSIAVADSEQYRKYQSGELRWTIVELTGVRPPAELQGPSRTYAGVMLGTISADSEYGLDARIDRWKTGAQGMKIAGSGFEYHTEFSCKFSNCRDFDYPHMPIMSEWLIGGLVAGLAAIGFYIGLLWAAWRRRAIIPAAALLVTMPYSMISGDTLFSLPQMMSVAMVVLLLPRPGSEVRAT